MIESKMQERKMNRIMFGVWGLLIPITACVFVLLFLKGNIRDTSVLSMTFLQY